MAGYEKYGECPSCNTKRPGWVNDQMWSCNYCGTLIAIQMMVWGVESLRAQLAERDKENARLREELETKAQQLKISEEDLSRVCEALEKIAAFRIGGIVKPGSSREVKHRMINWAREALSSRSRGS